jgi:hypothetical protein
LIKGTCRFCGPPVSDLWPFVRTGVDLDQRPIFPGVALFPDMAQAACDKVQSRTNAH